MVLWKYNIRKPWLISSLILMDIDHNGTEIRARRGNLAAVLNFGQYREFYDPDPKRKV